MKNDKLTNLKNVLKELISPTEHKLAMLNLSDGKQVEVSTEKIEKDSTVMLKAESGNIPLPAGEYTTEKGLKFSVNEEGVVTKTSEDEEIEPTKEELKEVKEELKAVKEQFTALSAKFDALAKTNQESFTKLSAALTDEPDKPNDKPDPKEKRVGNVMFNVNPKLESLTLGLTKK